MTLPSGGLPRSPIGARDPVIRQATPDVPDSRPIAAAAVLQWQTVQSRLAPIIGESGFRVLFARSLHRARGQHPWLARESAPSDVPFSMLRASIEAQPPDLASLGSRALMDHFNELLVALIGKDLVNRLLGPI